MTKFELVTQIEALKSSVNQSDFENCILGLARDIEVNYMFTEQGIPTLQPITNFCRVS